MPKKIREFKQILRKSGFTERPGNVVIQTGHIQITLEELLSVGKCESVKRLGQLMD